MTSGVRDVCRRPVADCRTPEARAVEALRPLGLDAPVGKVTGYGEIASRGVMATPALAIDDQVVLAGRVTPETELVDFIQGASS